MFPAIVKRRIFLRPYLSESAPIRGETMNCNVLRFRGDLVYKTKVSKQEGPTKRVSPLDHLHEGPSAVKFTGIAIYSVPSSTTSHFCEF